MKKQSVSKSSHRSSSGALTAFCVATGFLALGAGKAVAAEQPMCGKTIKADVVALDQPLMFNRLGAQNVNGMMYALRNDVITTSSATNAKGQSFSSETPLNQIADGAEPGSGLSGLEGKVSIRPDKRPRPLVLRVSEGDCLEVTFTNLLDPNHNPNNPGHVNQVGQEFFGDADDQVVDRMAGFHAQGMELVNHINDDSSFVGKNANSLAAPGETRTYTLYGAKENGYLAVSYGASFGSDGTAGNSANGLFGAVNVQPKGSRFYRSQVTEEEMRLATVGTSASGHPIIDYEATYPHAEPWISEGKAGLPVLRLTTADNQLVQSPLEAIIAGPDADGSWTSVCTGTDTSACPYPLESVGKVNPTLPERLQPFREFASIWHDENVANQAFPAWYNDPVLSHTLHGVRDAFMINYGSGGIGAEIIGNRLGVGPMYDCLSCLYEEFFLSAFTVGEPAQLVDIPANAGLEQCDPALNNCEAVGPKANYALYPDDPSNVHHSYTGDNVKIRNVHAGKEQHVFHLHNHQWLFNPDDDNSNYMDAQGIGPGSSYSYEIAFGGSGNRNKTSGDAIFHCHFYPHFAQGMWYLWRNHDTFEPGTELAVSAVSKDGFHDEPFALFNGTPANNQGIVDAGDPTTPVGVDYQTTSRALPDGELIVGAPTPGIVPLPGKAMAPMPGKVTVVAKDSNNDGTPDSSQAKVDRTDLYASGPLEGKLKNPGFPFWIGGIEETVGQRSPTPPLDMDPAAGGFDGGLPRHTLDGYIAGGTSVQSQTRLDFHKEVLRARPVFLPEGGTDVEKAAMDFHGQRCHDTAMPDGTAANCDLNDLNNSGMASSGGFITNGAPPVAGAPFQEPCIDDRGNLLQAGQSGQFFNGDGGMLTMGPVEFGANNPRTYKGASIQTDVVFNKVGYHFPQQRIFTLWEDVQPTLDKVRPPEPFVIRMNTLDCTTYQHANLIPLEYELDDYQVRTPTDIVGQHIHLPKWDLVSADGAGNGWNYEDGTLAPGTVIERIHAINEYNATAAEPVPTLDGITHLEPKAHPFFGAGPDGTWLGARTTIQRWFADPIVNVEGEDRGLGVIFTHDHFGPSTHQQVGLYATVLTEPLGSEWVHNETGEQFYTREDGGPTSWQAAILTGDRDGDGSDDSFREFYFEYSDFQHAYEKGVFAGVGPDGYTVVPPTETTFLNAINPSFRQQANPIVPDVGLHAPFCPGGVPRPCPEAISADDVGMLVVNYRNEPVGLRVYEPNKMGPDGKRGSQADGLAGDLAFALQTRTDRAIPELNTRFGNTPYPALTGDVRPGDAFTPMPRSYSGDTVKVKIQAGGHEHEHNAGIHGVKWMQGGSSFGHSPNSGWRNSQNDGISEQFTFSAPLVADYTQFQPEADYAYAMDNSHDGYWSGIWGVLRNYKQKQDDLFALPDTHPVVDALSDTNLRGLAKNFRNALDNGNRGNALKGLRNAVQNVMKNRGQNFSQFKHGGLCPADAPERRFDVTAVLANDVLGNAVGVTIPSNRGGDGDGDGIGDNVGGQLDPRGGTLVYNPRSTNIRNTVVVNDDGTTVNLGGEKGALHDPTAMMYVYTSDLRAAPTNWREYFSCRFFGGTDNPRCPVKLKSDAPVEPIVLRAAAGDCIQVTLRNRLPAVAPDLPGFNTLLQVVNRDRDPNNGLTWFHNNLIRPSSHVGMHPQLVEYDVTRSDGTNVGINGGGILDPFQTLWPGNPFPEVYTWYAGDIAYTPTGPGTFKMKGTPIEFGATNLLPADRVKQGQKGLVGSLVIEPQGSKWAENESRRDHQVDDPTAQRRTRTSATVYTPDGGSFRDLVTMFRKGQNHFYADGSAVQNLSAEGIGVPEDSHDAGQMSINYGSEPLWFRFGLAPDSPFGRANGAGFGSVPNAHQAYSNVLAGGQDPVTPVFTAKAGEEARLRVLMASGSGRGTTFNLHGHNWQRDPYVCPGSSYLGLEGKCYPDEVGSRAIGDNPTGMELGGQESVTPTAHYDLRVKAGGNFGVTGDYLFRDQASFGNLSGLWGILRVTE